MSDDEYGPVLPPGFPVPSKTSADTGAIGPALPPHLLGNRKGDSDSDDDSIGPSLPFHLKNQGHNETSSNTSKTHEVIGPILPPGFGSKQTKDNDTSIRPSLPENYKKKNIGPALPPGFPTTEKGDNSDDSDDDEVIGPLPSMMAQGDTSSAAEEFEKRAKQMKDKIEGKLVVEEKLERESWMTELPSAKLGQNIGLAARTFRVREGPDLSDQSAWTDTPADRERKAKGKKDGQPGKRSAESQFESSRDKKLKKEIDAYNESKRGESLMEMHKKKIDKAKKNEEDKPKLRQPFNRETDLQVNKFDEAQRQSIIKKSQKLNSRFGHGSSQFL